MDQYQLSSLLFARHSGSILGLYEEATSSVRRRYDSSGGGSADLNAAFYTRHHRNNADVQKCLGRD